MKRRKRNTLEGMGEMQRCNHPSAWVSDFVCPITWRGHHASGAHSSVKALHRPRRTFLCSMTIDLGQVTIHILYCIWNPQALPNFCILYLCVPGVTGIRSTHDLGLSDLIEAVLLTCGHNLFKRREGGVCALLGGDDQIRQLEAACDLFPSFQGLCNWIHHRLYS